jgi:hypothetical protein
MMDVADRRNAARAFQLRFSFIFLTSFRFLIVPFAWIRGTAKRISFEDWSLESIYDP